MEKKQKTCKMFQKDRLDLREAFLLQELHRVESNQKTKILMLWLTVLIDASCMLFESHKNNKKVNIFPLVFSFQKHWNVRTLFSTDRPIHCHFSYTATFLFYIRTNSKLLFLDKVTMTFVKIKRTTEILKIIILKMFS